MQCYKLFKGVLLSFFFSSLFSFQVHFESLEEPKTYDCFPFYNELEVLEIRLNELYSVVDFFVLVESVETHQGELKELFFESNKDRFAAFSDKIIHIIVEDRIVSDDHWDRENYQRDMIMRGLVGCKSNDVIFISDVDEIFPSKIIEEVKSRLYSRHEEALVCNQQMYHYFLNRQAPNYWLGTIVTNYLHLLKCGPQYFRDERFSLPNIRNGGWHFSSMGGIDRIMTKVQSCVPHTEDAVSLESKNPDFWKKIIRHGLALVPIDESFPVFVRDNLEYFKALGFVDTENFSGS